MQILGVHYPSLWSPDKRNQHCYNAVHLPIFKTSVEFDDAQTASSGSAKQARKAYWSLTARHSVLKRNVCFITFDLFVQDCKYKFESSHKFFLCLLNDAVSVL
jgi:hypothetical protein